MKPEISMSVRSVVELTLHESDLSPGAGLIRRMQEGTRAHLNRQRDGQNTLPQYVREVPLQAVFETDELRLVVQGRADALYMDGDMTVVEEIKLGDPAEPMPAHVAQCRFYGHMLCQSRGLEEVRLEVRYVDGDGQTARCFPEILTSEALCHVFEDLCRPAAIWQRDRLRRRAKRDEALENLVFPYEGFRPGQRELSAQVYAALRDRGRLFAQAPTGIGKTMAVLFPALHALHRGYCAKILFLTARTTGRRAALEALERLNPGTLLTAEISAKERICPADGRCGPDTCPYARGFYDRVPAALEEAMDLGYLTGDRLQALGEKYTVCPFELSLLFAQAADCVILDSNYVFDPGVRIDTLASPPGGACLLVDEAHRLPERVRDNYSAAFTVQELTGLRREIGKETGRKSPSYRACTALIALLKGDAALSPESEALRTAVRDVLEAGQRDAMAGPGPAMQALLQTVMAFQAAMERFCSRYAFLSEGEGNTRQVEIRLLDPAPEILAWGKRARGTVFFSATLLPLDSMRRMLGAAEGDRCITLPCPFDPAHLEARIVPLDLRYRRRAENLPALRQILEGFFERTQGNTMVFFPSYAMLGETAEGLSFGDRDPVYREARGMTREERDAILEAFSAGPGNCLLLCVLGGAFSEGIDLPGEQLRNAAVVTLGLPVPDRRMQALAAYYDGLGEDGTFLAMTMPGMVRIVQACGRLIRTEEDRGNLLLIDSRFRDPAVRACMAGTLVEAALMQNT